MPLQQRTRFEGFMSSGLRGSSLMRKTHHKIINSYFRCLFLIACTLSPTVLDSYSDHPLITHPTETRPDYTKSDRKGGVSAAAAWPLHLFCSHKTRWVKVEPRRNTPRFISFKKPRLYCPPPAARGGFRPASPSSSLLHLWASQQSKLNKAMGERGASGKKCLSLSPGQPGKRGGEGARERKDHGA